MRAFSAAHSCLPFTRSTKPPSRTLSTRPLSPTPTTTSTGDLPPIRSTSTEDLPLVRSTSTGHRSLILSTGRRCLCGAVEDTTSPPGTRSSQRSTGGFGEGFPTTAILFSLLFPSIHRSSPRSDHAAFPLSCFVSTMTQNYVKFFAEFFPRLKVFPPTKIIARNMLIAGWGFV